MNLLSEHPFSSGGLRVRLYGLDNGLRVLLLRDPAAPIFAYQTWFRVGSRHERQGKTGIAHLFEHLMFNETEHLKPGEFDRLIELQGGHTNAATWVDWTYYQDDLPSVDLELAVRLEADRMAHLLVRSSQIESEREVVMNERRYRVEDDVDGFLGEELFRLAFTSHPYHWPTIGWMRDIQAISLEDAQQFYRTYYAPNNATVIVVGDVEEQRTLDLIAHHYGGLPRQAIPVEPQHAEPRQEGERRATYKKPVAGDRLVIGYKAPPMGHPHHLHLQVLSDLLLGGASSRLYRDIFIERELVSSIGAAVMPFRDPGLWEISASLQRGHDAAEAEAVIYEHLARIAQDGPLEAEVERVKARALTRFYGGLRTAHGKAESLGEYETTIGDYRRLFAVPQELAQVTGADLQEVARCYLQPAARTVVIATPSGAPVEDEEQVPAGLSGAGHVGPVHRRGEPSQFGGGRP